MEDYIIAGLAVFRYIEPRFYKFEDHEIAELYRQWSDLEASASWLGVTPEGARRFCVWAFTPPALYLRPDA